ncbi:GNAT family N-acetyltransferase [Streptomyces thermolilacinus]|uniref:N-acetyltransferase domain-containing protein n=1 Tax=Streptomyces thermolilacinus SPC6 TaxID=1306406 RepID=A0A1D3E0D0_9ACTN|nr:GNAT family N-acetyltransferase [Streptomyces thermolilacinus]OEJ98029.1 hypothetical protein J116_012475 [Streptomyces thermolilacinus SPC6]
MAHPGETVHGDGDVVLRRWRAESDFDGLRRLIEGSLEHLRPWFEWVERYGDAHVRGFLERCEADWRGGVAYNWAIEAGGELTGSCSLYRAEEPGGWHIGYWLHPGATGRGIASRAAAAMVDEAFGLAEVAYVEIVHDAANGASGAVARRLGFVEVERLRVEPVAPGECGVDVVWRRVRAA